MSHGASTINLLDEDSQMDEDDLEVNDIMRPPPSKSQRKNSTSGSGSSTASSNVKGTLNLFFSQKPNEKRKGEAIGLDSCRKSLRERAVDAFARWMYDAGVPFNCVNYTDSFGEFIEAVGQYGPGMKPPTYHEAIKIHSYISQRSLLLNIMRRYTKQRNLVKPAKTRFATAILTLHSFYLQKQNLRTLFLSTEWSESIYAKEALGKEVARFIIGPYFWNDIVQALKVGNPLVIVLRLVDGEKKPPMGYIYEAMDRAKEAIEKAFDHDRRKYESVFEIIDKKWDDQLHQPLHTAGHILNPGMFYTNNENKTLDLDVWKGYHACVAKLVPDEAMQDKIGQELGLYMQADGILGLASAIRGRTKLAPAVAGSDDDVYGDNNSKVTGSSNDVGDADSDLETLSTLNV
ncbi:hypothetical protein A4A49_34741 [Nicotiana attenuata]|uniref:DUF659 domain-containing protein n=1 Tax=Nicotiana attenuata TaxID=49451 RepID=A0A314KS78_NICAT|nr:hypothetical protein A4A49_34741 [Nicotiana attenuata]